MMDLEKVDTLMGKAVYADLSGADWLFDFPLEVIAREYNGIGPEWAGESVRSIATHYLALFEPAALIHDMRNYASDGSLEKFHAANEEFAANCRKLACQKYAWYDWRRYRALAVARCLFGFVESIGGFAAWLDCYRAKNKEENS